MRQLRPEPGVRVFDEVLDRVELAGLQEWADRISYHGVHHGQWRKVWRIGEGEPLRGPTWWAGRSDDPSEDGYPFELDPVVEALRHTLLTGALSDARVSLTPWIYPQGTALGLHVDSEPYLGSYVYYLMPEWDLHWGGLLHFLPRQEGERVTRPSLTGSDERGSMQSIRGGSWVLPRCNRLVLIAPWVEHFVSRIDPNAGDRSRLTIAGFVHRP